MQNDGTFRDLENHLPDFLDTPESRGTMAALQAKSELQGASLFFDDPIHVRRDLMHKGAAAGWRTPIGPFGFEHHSGLREPARLRPAILGCGRAPDAPVDDQPADDRGWRGCGAVTIRDHAGLAYTRNWRIMAPLKRRAQMQAARTIVEVRPHRAAGG